MAQVDYFLKVEGIKGESKDANHKDEIDIVSYSWGATQTGVGSDGKGKVNLQDFHVTMTNGAASAQLWHACATGKPIPTAVLTARKAGKEQQEYLKIKLYEVSVSSYQTGGTSDSGTPTDQVSFSFAKIEHEYKEQKPDGSLGGTTKVGYDLKQNKKS